jgi:uncharacterized membrane protein
MIKKVIWIIIVVLAISIGLYPSIYFIIDRNFGLLSTKTEFVLTNLLWNIAFYFHITFGAIALLIGWIGFSKSIRANNLNIHKITGKVYVVSVLLSALAGIYIAFYATSGIVASIGFISLGVLWFYTTLMAFMQIKNKNIVMHQKLMIYSYALCFAAVTLRVWMPIMIYVCNDFGTGYKIASWLCWIPNLIVAYFINKNTVK